MAWAFSGRVTNPVLDAILVTTGALATAKQRMFQVACASTVAAPMELQWLGADGITIKGRQIIAVQALDTKWSPPQLEEINMLANESVRVIAVTAITGQVSCSIDYTL
jgi:hypothetical protein